MKLQKISTQVSPFSGICFINEEYGKSGFTQLLDKQLGIICKPVGFSYSNIIQNLMNVFFCGGDYAEDIQSHLSSICKNRFVNRRRAQYRSDGSVLAGTN